MENNIGKSAFRTKSTNFDWVQNGTKAMVDLWMYNFARNILFSFKKTKSDVLIIES